MNKANQKLEDAILEEFYRIKIDLGHAPSRVEMFTYMDEDLYYNMKKKSKVNIFKDYMKFLNDNNETNYDESEILNTLAHEFINLIENTSMTKVPKIPLLLAFYNEGKMKLEIDDEDIYKSFKSFYNSGCNAIDMLKDKSTKNFKTWTEKQYISFARKNPVHFFCKSSSKFFTINEEKVCLNKGLQQYLNNPVFINHVKDAIDFRQKEYYKNRFYKK